MGSSESTTWRPLAFTNLRIADLGALAFGKVTVDKLDALSFRTLRIDDGIFNSVYRFYLRTVRVTGRGSNFSIKAVRNFFMR